MKKSARIIILFGVISCLFYCKKSDKDTVSGHSIHGVVFNNCTDSGLAGVEVFLQTFKDDKELVQQLSTISGPEGKFLFENAEIHSSDKFNYALHIESKSGTAAQTAEQCGFNGTTMFFFKDEVELEFKPRVTPKFLRCCIQVNPLQKVVQPDSLSVLFEQNTFHKNVPDFPYTGWYGPYFTGTAPDCSWGNYPMGLWRIKIEKWRNGVYTLSRDSIYLDWKSAKSYSVQW